MLQISEWKICHFWLFSIIVMVTDKCIKISNKQLTLSHCFWSRIDQEMCQFSKDITQCHQWQVPNILWWPIHDDDALSLPCLLVASNCLKRLCPRLNCDWMNLASWAVYLRNCKRFKNVTPLHFKPEEAAHGHYWTGDKKSYWLANKWQVLHKQNKNFFRRRPPNFW